MEKNFILNRHTVLGGAAALGTVGVLAACGSSMDSRQPPRVQPWAPMPRELYDLAGQSVSELKDGGTLRLAIPGIGPDFNLSARMAPPVHPAAMSPGTTACGRVTHG